MGKAQDFFVNIESPSELRRPILESSREVIHLMQDFESLKSIRTEKSETMEKLDNVMKEISVLVTKLKAELPKVPASKKKTTLKKTSVRKKTVVKKVESKPKSDLDKLEAELNDVEKQLAELQ